MPTFRSIQEYRQTINNRIKKLNKQNITTSKQAAKLMVQYAKKFAPRSSGQTISGIRKRKRKGSWVVESKVPGNFKQNLFANMKVPFRTLNFGAKGGGRAYAPNQKVRYGQPAKSRSGKQIRWTAHGAAKKIGFFNLAALRTRPKFRKFAVDNTRKILRAKF